MVCLYSWLPSLGEVAYTTTVIVTPELFGTTRKAIFRHYCDDRRDAFMEHETGVLLPKRKYFTKYMRIPYAIVIDILQQHENIIQT